MTMQATKQAARRAPFARLRTGAQALARFIRWAPVRVWLSAAVMGLGQLCHGQIIKGLLFMGLEAAGIWYFIVRGARDFIGFFTLGTQEEDLWMGIKGDNSMNMLILGIFAIILLCFLILLWVCNIRDAAFTARQVEKGKKPRSFPETLAALADERFHVAALCLPAMAETSAMGKPVALDASAEERLVRGLISMMMSRSFTGSCAHCTFVPPITCTESTIL